MSEKNTQAEAPSERDAAIEEAFESARFALLRPNSLQSMAHIMDVLHCRVQDVFHQRVAALATQQAGQGEAWREIGSIRASDDLVWLYDQSSNTIDGPVNPSESYVDSWTHWAWAEAPSTAAIRAARSSEGGQS